MPHNRSISFTIVSLIRIQSIDDQSNDSFSSILWFCHRIELDMSATMLRDNSSTYWTCIDNYKYVSHSPLHSSRIKRCIGGLFHCICRRHGSILTNKTRTYTSALVIVDEDSLVALFIDWFVDFPNSRIRLAKLFVIKTRQWLLLVKALITLQCHFIGKTKASNTQIMSSIVHGDCSSKSDGCLLFFELQWTRAITE
jgi:hypothetical protein